ncbi:hypothetical protein [Streptomyces sp. NPDC000851]
MSRSFGAGGPRRGRHPHLGWGAGADEGSPGGRLPSVKAADFPPRRHRSIGGAAPRSKEAVKHVTKVTGADKRNDILDAPEVFTDFTGGLVGPHAGEGKLIASAFTSCYESDNGLVTVYDKDGEILANANY